MPSYFNWKHVVNGVASTSTQYITTQQVDDAIAWIGGQSGPWLCTLSFVAPHLPMHVPPSHLHSPGGRQSLHLAGGHRRAATQETVE